MRSVSAWPTKLVLRPCSFSRTSTRLKSSASTRTDFQANDAKWQAIWQQRATSVKPKKYVLPMFAYPSGSLHMGHLRVYTISDVLARYHRMKGYDVLHPTGWDSFGLPAENAAIERGLDPRQWTMANIEKMKGQLKSMNTDFDWEHEISTCSPSFYKHTQKLFLMLYRKGLAYQAEALVNYDPVDKTVLANEQVDNDGRSWRSGALVQQRMLKQWFFKITAFRDALLNDLDALAENNRWPDRVIQQQRHWIGRSKGATITFNLLLRDDSEMPIKVFTTRPDTLFGVTYLALSMSHPIVTELAKTDPKLADFLARRPSFDADSKEGIELPIQAVNPASRLASNTVSSLPVFTAPYVLEGYGEGAVMGVPAHDNRDFSFWNLNKPNHPAPLVILPATQNGQPSNTDLNEAYTGSGLLTSVCDSYAGMHNQEAATMIVHDLEQLGLAKESETWRLRDWLISRQRYWGTPIPIIHCDSCGALPVPDKDLPVELPDLRNDIQGQKGNPLDSIQSFVDTQCPSCGKPAKRETDTMDTFVDSSWYYARFPDSQNEDELFSKAAANKMLPVDMYVGGVEHAILHLLYARFIFKFLCQEGLIPSTNDTFSKEPFSRLIAQGMVHGRTFSDPDTGRFLKPEDRKIVKDSLVLVKATDKVAKMTWEKMSKSKHNGVDPITCFQKYGADLTRAHMLFAAPLSEVLQWDESKIKGVERWLQRISYLLDWFRETIASSKASLSTSLGSTHDYSTLSDDDTFILLFTNSTIASITATLESNIYNINTVVSDLMKLTNKVYDYRRRNLEPWVIHDVLLYIIKMLAPIAPAFAEQCFEDFHYVLMHQTQEQSAALVQDAPSPSIFEQSWPVPFLTPAAEDILQSRMKTTRCAVQVNGRTKFVIDVPAPQMDAGKPIRSDEHDDAVLASILASKDGHHWLKMKNNWEDRKKVVVVGGGKVVNVVFAQNPFFQKPGKEK